MFNQVKSEIIWSISLSVFLLAKMWRNTLFSPGTVAGGLIAIYCLWAFIVPFLKKETISPGGGLEFRRGEHDFYRLLYFTVGVFLYLICLSN